MLPAIPSWHTCTIGKVAYLQIGVLGKSGCVLNGLILLEEKLSEDCVTADAALNKNLILETVISLESVPICQISGEGERL